WLSKNRTQAANPPSDHQTRSDSTGHGSGCGPTCADSEVGESAKAAGLTSRARSAMLKGTFTYDRSATTGSRLNGGNNGPALRGRSGHPRHGSPVHAGLTRRRHARGAPTRAGQGFYLPDHADPAGPGDSLSRGTGARLLRPHG